MHCCNYFTASGCLYSWRHCVICKHNDHYWPVYRHDCGKIRPDCKNTEGSNILQQQKVEKSINKKVENRLEKAVPVVKGSHMLREQMTWVWTLELIFRSRQEVKTVFWLEQTWFLQIWHKHSFALTVMIWLDLGGGRSNVEVTVTSRAGECDLWGKTPGTFMTSDTNTHLDSKDELGRFSPKLTRCFCP